jgi:hypothetical protein
MPPRMRGRRPLPRAGKRSGAREEWARLGSNQQPLVCKTSALPLSYSPACQIRDKGSNLDLHVQSVVSCRLDDPGVNGQPLSRAPVVDRRTASPSILRAGRSTQQAAPAGWLCRVLCLADRSRAMLSMPLAYPSTLDRRPQIVHVRCGRRPTWRDVGARASSPNS